jgi:mono/diheme cytochrome c family protein
MTFTDRHDSMPARVLPWLYFGCAWLALALAFAAVAIDPRGAAGFFYHARLAGIVHLVTLGWITMSILGALYIVGPITLRIPLPAHRGDAVAFASTSIGIVGMVGHFWIEDFGGMAWSGVMVALGILYVGVRVVRRLIGAPVTGGVKFHVMLAFANIAVAASMGVLLAFDKDLHFLPGFVLTNVFAHAHLAAIGWASMMVVGIGYRLLPMVLPAEMPRSKSVYASGILLEIGVLGLFVALLLQSMLTRVFALIIVAGFAVFLGHVAGMVKRRRRRPLELPAIDFAVRHTVSAFLSLAIAIVLGSLLAFANPSEWTLRAALAYGVFGLVGFLAQMVAGMQLRLLPLLAWYSAAHRAASPGDIPSMSRLSAHPLVGAGWLLWLWGVPALATGFALNAIPLLAAGAAALEAAVLLGAMQAGRLAAYAFPGVTLRIAGMGSSEIQRVTDLSAVFANHRLARSLRMRSQGDRKNVFRALLVVVLFGPAAAYAGQVAAIPSSTGELYSAWCAKCHAEDGSGRVAVSTVKTPPRDFADCRLSSPEPDADWELVTAQGGPPAGMSSEMPAYGELLDAERIRGLIAHLRKFCKETGWPSGNLNFPRAMFTEKAFPENEVVILPVIAHVAGEPTTFRLRSVYERRFGRRAHGEIGVPIESLVADRRSTGVGDITVAGKYVLHTNRATTSIVTGGLEVVLPTGVVGRSFGSGPAVFEPYLASGVAIGRTVVQGQLKLELPASAVWAQHETVYNFSLGHTLDDRPSAWTFGVELNGIEKDVAVTPQARKALTRTGALAAAAGVRIPLNNRSTQPVRYVGYVLWEYLDPVRPRP